MVKIGEHEMSDLMVRPRGNNAIDGNDCYHISESIAAVKFTATDKDNDKGGKDWKSHLISS